MIRKLGVELSYNDQVLKADFGDVPDHYINFVPTIGNEKELVLAQWMCGRGILRKYTFGYQVTLISELKNDGLTEVEIQKRIDESLEAIDDKFIIEHIESEREYMMLMAQKNVNIIY